MQKALGRASARCTPTSFAPIILPASAALRDKARDPFQDRLPPSMKPVTRRARLKGRLRCLRAPCRLDQAVLMIDVPWLEYRATNPQLSKRYKKRWFPPAIGEHRLYSGVLCSQL